MEAENIPVEEAHLSISELINLSLDLRNRAADLDKAAKELRKQRELINGQLIEKMEEMGLDRTGNSTANVSISTKELPQVKDWDQFYGYILENEYLHLLQRRVSSKAIEEAASLGDVPGIEFYTKKDINLRVV